MSTELQPRFLETGVSALAFAAVFLAGRWLHPAQLIIRSHRSLLSFSAGISIAYAFVRVMPEMASARQSLIQSVSFPLRFEGMAIYVMALVGFLTFYGLDHFGRRARQASVEGKPRPAIDIRLLGYASYVALTAYLLVNTLDSSSASSALYAVAMAVHFLTFDHAFREEPGDAYRSWGHLVLAGAAIAGWATGWAVTLPRGVVALMFGFLSGSIIVNGAIAELPDGKGGRFLPFLAGSLLYAAVLLPL